MPVSDLDDLAEILAAVPRDPATPRDVTLAAAQYGWFPDPPWFPVSMPAAARGDRP